jgi:hypothetical protein
MKAFRAYGTPRDRQINFWNDVSRYEIQAEINSNRKRSFEAYNTAVEKKLSL